MRRSLLFVSSLLFCCLALRASDEIPIEYGHGLSLVAGVDDFRFLQSRITILHDPMPLEPKLLIQGGTNKLDAWQEAKTATGKLKYRLSREAKAGGAFRIEYERTEKLASGLELRFAGVTFSAKPGS